MSRKIATLEIKLRSGKFTHDALADELERIAELLRQEYQSGEVLRESQYRGWWDTTEALR